VAGSDRAPLDALPHGVRVRREAGCAQRTQPSAQSRLGWFRCLYSVPHSPAPNPHRETDTFSSIDPLVRVHLQAITARIDP